jgi:hypothetical protein
VFAPKQGPNGRKAGYSYMQGLIEIVIDPVRCPHAAKSFQTFESKLAPDGKGWLDEPGTMNDHDTDCCRYSEWQNIQNSEYNEDFGGCDSISSRLDEDDEEDFIDYGEDFGIDLDDEFSV